MRLFAVAALVLVAGGEAAAFCAEDEDCKLIYSSCGCEAVETSDLRDVLPSNVDCTVNRCRVERVQAVCVDDECTTRSARPTPRP